MADGSPCAAVRSRSALGELLDTTKESPIMDPPKSAQYQTGKIERILGLPP
jgi:hypothetical protein